MTTKAEALYRLQLRLERDRLKARMRMFEVLGTSGRSATPTADRVPAYLREFGAGRGSGARTVGTLGPEWRRVAFRVGSTTPAGDRVRAHAADGSNILSRGRVRRMVGGVLK